MTKDKGTAQENGKAIEPITAPDGASSSAQRSLQVLLTTVAAKDAQKSAFIALVFSTTRLQRTTIPDVALMWL